MYIVILLITSCDNNPPDTYTSTAVNRLFSVIQLFETCCSKLKFPLLSSQVGSPMSAIGATTIETFRSLLSLMHTTSESLLDLCSLKKTITNLVTRKEMSVLFGYSRQYGTGLEFAALYFRCVLDPLLRSGIFIMINLVS